MFKNNDDIYVNITSNLTILEILAVMCVNLDNPRLLYLILYNGITSNKPNNKRLDPF